MKLTKILDASKRPTSTVELLLSYLFNSSNTPTEFIPGQVYNVGDVVYTIVNGSPIIYTCIESGSYDSLEDGWTSYDLGTLIADQSKDYIDSVLGSGSNGVTNPYGQNDTGLAGIRKFYEYSVYDETSLDIEGNTLIRLPVKYDKFDTLLDLYINGQRLSELDDDYVVLEKKNKVKLINYTLDEEDSLVLYIAKGASHNAKLIIEEDLTVYSIENDQTLVIGIDPCLVNPVIDLYYMNLYVDPDQYTVEFTDNAVRITMSNPGDYLMLKQNFYIRYTASRSKHISVKHAAVNLLENPIEDLTNFNFRFDLNETAFIDGIENYRVYLNGEVVNGGSLNIFNHTLSIMDTEDYVTDSVVSAWLVGTYYVVNVDITYGDTVRYHEESLTVISSDEMKHIPVPFIDYDRSYQRYMLLKEDGTYVSSRKYYEKEEVVHYYNHEEGLVSGDVMNFLLINNDPSVNVVTRFVTIEEDDQQVIPIPKENFNSGDTTILLFKSMGSYVSKIRYTIDDATGTIRMNDSIGLLAGDILEFLFISYEKPSVNSLRDLRSAVASYGYIRLPYYNLNFDTDTIMLFRDNGTYVGNSRYTIEPGSYTIEMNSGTPITDGECFDVLVIRDLGDPISKLVATSKNESL